MKSTSHAISAVGRVSVAIPDEVVRRFAFKREMSLDDAVTLFSRLEDFLDSAATENIAPSPIIDEAWHEFILHTKLYSAFCHAKYGHFVHHVPTSAILFDERAAPLLANGVPNVRNGEDCSAGREACSSDCSTASCGSDK